MKPYSGRLILLVFLAGMGLSLLAPSLTAVPPADASTALLAYNSADIIGTSMLPTGQSLNMHIGQLVNDPASAAQISDIQWRLNGKLISSAPDLSIRVNKAGEYTLELSYVDTSGQRFEAQRTVQILPPDAFQALAADISAAASLSLWEEDSTLYLPLIER